MDFRHVIECLGRKQRALLLAELQADILPGENWSQLWRELLFSLAPDEASKVMVDALHVAAAEDVLAGVEGHLRRSALSLNTLRGHYGLRTSWGLSVFPRLEMLEHQLSGYDELLGGPPQSDRRWRVHSPNS